MQRLLSLEYTQGFIPCQHTAQGGPCVTQHGWRLPQLLTLTCIEGLLLCKGRARPASEALLDPAWEALYGVTHKSPEACQIQSFLVKLCPGPICCHTLRQLSHRCWDGQEDPKASPPLSSLSSFALQLWFYAKGRLIRLEHGAHCNLTKKYKRNCTYSSTKHSACFHERISLLLFVGICLNPLAKWLWNSRGLKGSTGEPPDWIKYFKPRRQGKIVISNWKSTRLWQ